MKARFFWAACLLWTSSLISWSQAGNSRTHSGTSSSSILSGGLNLRSISGAPFSADVIQESTQLQPDGSRIAIETHGRMLRDSAGRIRSESEIAGVATGAATRRYVTIFDPVAQLNVRLDPQAKTATLFSFPAAPAPISHEVALKLAKASTQINSTKHDLAVSQDLGPATMQGFAVTGTRRPLPAKAGVERARIVTVESWFSPELKIELQSVTDDPMLGVRTTKLMNIISTEPDPAMFQVPAGYTIKDNSLRK